ncbi:hypothetical protein Bca101_020183 [Brassica carinata]
MELRAWMIFLGKRGQSIHVVLSWCGTEMGSGVNRLLDAFFGPARNSKASSCLSESLMARIVQDIKECHLSFFGLLEKMATQAHIKIWRGRVYIHPFLVLCSPYIESGKMNNYAELPSLPASLVGSHVQIPGADREAVPMAPLKHPRSYLLDDGPRSEIRDDDLMEIRIRYGVSLLVRIRCPSEYERAPDGGDNEIAVFEAYLEASYPSDMEEPDGYPSAWRISWLLHRSA